MVLTHRVDQPAQLGVLTTHRGHRVPALHEPIQLAVQGRLDGLDVRQQLTGDETVLDLARLAEPGCDRLAEHLGQLGQAVDVRHQPVVMLVAGLGQGRHAGTLSRS